MKDEPEITLHAAEVEPTVPRRWRHPAVWIVGAALAAIVAAVVLS